MKKKLVYVFICLLLIVGAFLLKPDNVHTVLDQYRIESISEWKAYKSKIRFQIQDKIYGFLPKDLNVDFKVTKNQYLEAYNAHYKEIIISFEGIKKNILLSLFVPNQKIKPGVFLVLNRCGAHTLVDDLAVSIRPHAAHHKLCLSHQSRGSDKKHYAVKRVLESGYAFATIDGAELAADGYVHNGISKSEKNSDLISLLQTHEDKNKSWGTIAAWAYGYQLGSRYLKTDYDINSEQIIASGHSRRGKAALLAAALDENISMVIPHQSGTGGTASLKNTLFRESPKQMLGKSWIYSFIGDPGTLSHFFSKQFKKEVKKKSIDASHMIALVAPRPMLDTQGVKDFWAGGKSAWRMLKEANSVYRLHGVEGLKKKKWFGSSNEPLSVNNTGLLHQYYFQTGHGLNNNYWNLSIQFADLHFKN